MLGFFLVYQMGGVYRLMTDESMSGEPLVSMNKRMSALTVQLSQLCLVNATCHHNSAGKPAFFLTATLQWAVKSVTCLLR